MEPIVYIVDDDEAVRDSLFWLLDGSPYRVECHASAESFLRSYRPGEPACLVVDVRMPGMSGLEVQDALVERGWLIPVIFITGHGDVPMAVSTMKKGAFDFIEKPFNEAELRALIDRALADQKVQFEKAVEQRKITDLIATLTPREHEVMEHVVAGRLNKQIADLLGISIKTVEVHRARVMEKLNANSVAELVQTVLASKTTA